MTDSLVVFSFFLNPQGTPAQWNVGGKSPPGYSNQEDDVSLTLYNPEFFSVLEERWARIQVSPFLFPRWGGNNTQDICMSPAKLNLLIAVHAFVCSELIRIRFFVIRVLQVCAPLMTRAVENDINMFLAQLNPFIAVHILACFHQERLLFSLIQVCQCGKALGTKLPIDDRFTRFAHFGTRDSGSMLVKDHLVTLSVVYDILFSAPCCSSYGLPLSAQEMILLFSFLSCAMPKVKAFLGTCFPEDGFYPDAMYPASCCSNFTLEIPRIGISEYQPAAFCKLGKAIPTLFFSMFFPQCYNRNLQC